MTEAELWGLIVDYNDSLLAATSLYMTILSGYLIVAYLSGENLTGMQSAIITFAFILAALIFVWAVRGYGYRAIFLIGKTSEQYQTSQMMNEPSLLLVLAIMMGGILAALKFMWDIRHPKTE